MKLKKMNLNNAVAVVGIGCRFPGADNPEEYWEVLVNGENHIQKVPDERWNTEQYYSKDKNEAGKTYAVHAGLLKDDIRKWDNKPFGINTMEAEVMDPQQRLALETSYRALEDGGFTLDDISGTNTAVYMGQMTQDYQTTAMMVPEFLDNYSATGSMNSILANRLSYFYNLHGPSVTLDTACSSGLVAVNMGTQSILSGQSDMAVCGGVSCILLPSMFVALSKARMASEKGQSDMAVCGGVSCILLPSMFVALSKARMASEKGQCHTYSEEADGYVRSEGCGIVILKSIEKAIADGNKIWGIVTSACNSDGKSTTPITAPSSEKQAELIRDTIKQAGVEAQNVQFVEMHGTGTPVGDPVECTAVGQVLGAARLQSKLDPIPVGSVKTNIGHLEAAAGIAGLIKVLLMMKHETLVPSVIFGKLKESLDFKGKHIEVLQSVKRWEPLLASDDNARIASVNSFGFGGTNVHLIAKMSDRYKTDKSKDNGLIEGGSKVVLFNGIDSEAIKTSIAEVAKRLEDGNNITLDALSHTSCNHRQMYSRKLAITADNKDQLQERLLSVMESGSTEIGKRISSKDKQNIIFVFCGMGTHWDHMGQALYEKEPVYRSTIDTIHALFQTLDDDFDLKQCLAGKRDLSDPKYGQPSIFATQVALFHLWKSKHITPHVIVGHSVGEVASAYASGNLSLRDAAFIIYHRGHVVSKAKDGGMLAVGNLPIEHIQKLLEPYKSDLDIAAINTPTSCTISGGKTALDQLQAELEALDPKPFVRRLAVKVAYHSRFMDPILDELKTSLSSRQYQRDGGEERRIKQVSTVRGEVLEANEYSTPEYWKSNVRQTVLFSEAMQEALIQDGTNVVVEIGPKPALKSNIKELANGLQFDLFPSMAAAKSEIFYNSLERVYEYGAYERKPGFRPLCSVPRYGFNRVMLYRESELAKNLREGKQSIPQHNSHPFVSCNTDTDNVASCSIAPKTTPFVFEHKVGGNIVVPGATYAEMGLAAVSLLSSASKNAPKQFIPDQHLPLSMKVNFNQVCLMKTESSTAELKVSCFKDGDEEKAGKRHFFDVTSGETLHATGYVTKEESSHSNEGRPKLNIARLKKNHKTSFDQDTFYNNLSKFGFEYGPSLRCVKRGSTNNADESVIEIQVPEGTDLDHTFFHPAVLDSILQSGVLFTNAGGKQPMNGDQMLPYGIRKVSLHRKLTNTMFLHMRKMKSLDLSMKVDAVLADQSGEVIAECNGITYGVMGKHTNFDVEQNTFQLAWEPFTMDTKAGSTADNKYLVFHDGDCAFPFDVLKGSVSIVALNKNGIDSIAQDEEALRNHIPANFEQYTAVLYFAGFHSNLPSIDQIDGGGMDGIIQRKTFTLLQMVKIIGHIKNAPPIYAITKGVYPFLNQQRITGDQPLEALIGVTVNAICRTVNKELPAFPLYSLDINDIRDQDSELIENVISAPQPYYELAISQGCLLFGTLDSADLTLSVPGRVMQVTSQDHVTIHANGSKQSRDKMMILKPDNKRAVAHHKTQVALSIDSALIDTNDKTNSRRNDKTQLTALNAIGTTQGTKYHICQQLKVGSEACINEANSLKWSAFPSRYPTLSYWLTVWKVMGRFKRNQIVFVLEASEPSIWDLIIKSMARLLHLKLTEHTYQAEIIIGVTNDLESVQIPNMKPEQALVMICEKYSEIPEELQLPNVKVEYASLIFPADKIAEDIQGFKAWLHKTDKKRLKYELNSFEHNMQALSNVYTMSDFTDVQVPLTQNTFVSMQRNGKPIHMVADSPNTVIRKQAAYLVVGGRTGLGWETVKFLIEKGAKYIGIVSRSGLGAEKETEVERLEKDNGCVIVDLHADTCKFNEVQKALSVFQERTNVPIKGVLYGAAVTCDAIIPTMTLDKFMKALSPKVAGVWNVYLATRHMPLDIFTMFSSITSLFGNAGQTNYATGNAFKDAVASLRRIQTGVGQSLCWGALDLGILNDNQHARKKVQVLGLAPMKVSEILASLDHALVSNKPVIAYCRFIWPAWYRYLSSAPDVIKNQYRALIERHCHYVKAKSSSKDGGAAVEKGGNKEYIVEVLKKVAVLEDEDISMTSSMTELGADSQDKQKIYNIIMADIGFAEDDMSLIEMGDLTLSELVNRIKETTTKGNPNGMSIARETKENTDVSTKEKIEEIKPKPRSRSNHETKEMAIPVHNKRIENGSIVRNATAPEFQQDEPVPESVTKKESTQEDIAMDTVSHRGKQSAMFKSTPNLCSNGLLETKKTNKSKGLKAMTNKLRGLFSSKKNIYDCSTDL